MKKKNVMMKTSLVFFKRWQNKSYSVFNSIGKIIIMLMLPLAYLSVFNSSVLSQDTLNLQKIVVQSNKKPILFSENFRLVKIITKNEINSVTADNLSDLLKSSLGVDVRQRGINEVQSDISINGGTFEQVLILLNGVPMSDVQTGHHSFTLPVNLEDLESIEVLQGPGTRLYGLNAFSGAINFVTKPDSKNSANLKTTFGNFGYKQASFGSNFKIAKTKNILSLSSANSLGYSENTDFSVNKIYFLSQLKQKQYLFSFQTGITTKNFGAFNFYTPNFPYQYESINNEIISAKIEFGGFVKSSVNIFFRRNQDKFELFREDEDWYIHSGDYFIRNQNDTAKYVQDLYLPSIYYSGHNYHVSKLFGANYNLLFKSNIGETVIGVEFKQSSILSNILGENSDSVSVLFEKDAWYTKSAKQDNYSFFIDHSLLFNKFFVSIGASINYNSVFDFYHAFGTDIAYKINNELALFVSVNQGIRLPTFTDLYYQGPSNIGNLFLKPEKSTSFEFGQKIVKEKFIFQSEIFYRFGRNIIDWVKISDEYLWQPMNYTQINTLGVNISSKVFFNRKILKFVDFNYSYLYQTKPELEYSSKYVLDYPSNTFSTIILLEPFKNFNISFNLLYKKREGSYTFPNEFMVLNEILYKPYFLLNLGFKYNFKRFNLFLSFSNLLNTEYHDLSNVKLPGRLIKTGISFKLY